jgi:hypothetical protein
MSDEAHRHSERGARFVCWLVLSLTAAATAVCVALFGPRWGVPKLPGDGSLLILAAVGIALLSVPALLLLVPARRTVRVAAPALWRSTRISAAALSGYVLFVAYTLCGLGQSTDL